MYMCMDQCVCICMSELWAGSGLFRQDFSYEIGNHSVFFRKQISFQNLALSVIMIIGQQHDYGTLIPYQKCNQEFF